MKTQEAIAKINQGRLIECTKDEYLQIRTDLQNQAGRWIDSAQTVKAIICLNEIKRLDEKHLSKS